MSYRNTTFGNVLQGKAFYYDQQRWHKLTSALIRTKHNAYSADGMRNKLFNSNTLVKVEIK